MEVSDINTKYFKLQCLLDLLVKIFYAKSQMVVKGPKLRLKHSDVAPTNNNNYPEHSIIPIGPENNDLAN